MAVKFVVYIDESGDTGLELVKPDPGGATEWLVLSGLVVKIEDDTKLVSWIGDLQADFSSKTPTLHFNRLLPFKKSLVCNALAKKPCACFVVMSNKKNIEKYKNPNLDDDNKAWIYWWLSRLLLERVTQYCESLVPKEGLKQDTLRIVFSRRGGLVYRDFNDYLWKLYWQSGTGTLHIGYKDLCWSVINFEEIFVLDHKERAGLQLTDIVAGAFFQAVEQNRGGLDCDPTYAKCLKPVMAVNANRNVLGFGLKTMPSLYDMRLNVPQREIFEFYGYSKLGWWQKKM
jgi:hypothetical protein